MSWICEKTSQFTGGFATGLFNNSRNRFAKKISQFFSHPKNFANNFAKICSNIFNPKICANNWANVRVFLALQIFEIYEPELESLVNRNITSGRLKFSLEKKENIKIADAIFIAVGTPARRGDGNADLSFVFDAAEEIPF